MSFLDDFLHPILGDQPHQTNSSSQPVNYLAISPACNLIKCSGSVAFIGVGNPFTGNSMLPFVLDDMGCSGSERNLLECLPRHNCGSSNENAGVRCLRKGNSVELVLANLCMNLIYLIDRSVIRNGSWSACKQFIGHSRY